MGVKYVVYTRINGHLWVMELALPADAQRAERATEKLATDCEVVRRRYPTLISEIGIMRTEELWPNPNTSNTSSVHERIAGLVLKLMIDAEYEKTQEPFPPANLQSK